MAENTAATYCVKEEKACVGWVYKHFNYCLCNTRDEFSFILGAISLVCYGVAKIPQIVTNFRNKSSHGISFVFLVTSFTGDIFNLVGCLLEPATLPSQLYTALLFITASMTLLLQSLYYDYLYECWKHKDENSNQQIEEVKKPLRPQKSGVSGIPIPNVMQAGYGAFLATSINMPQQAKALMSTYVAFGGRKLLQEHGTEHSATGQWLGWMMAAIYMSSRVPQIWLNGSNPFMFIFAVIANSTYVGSIVVRTTEWDKTKPNLPWLLDAAGCAVLDSFIILQYIYYRNFRKKASEDIEGYEDYERNRLCER